MRRGRIYKFDRKLVDVKKWRNTRYIMISRRLGGKNMRERKRDDEGGKEIKG